MKIRNLTRGRDLADRAEVATGLLRRGLGLMGRDGWAATDGLVLEHCNSIHTYFMRMSIDLVYLGRDDLILRTVEHLAPWRIGPIVWRTQRVLELPAGTLAASGTEPGDRVELSLA